MSSGETQLKPIRSNDARQFKRPFSKDTRTLRLVPLESGVDVGNSLFSEIEAIDLSPGLGKPMSERKPRVSKFGQISYSKADGVSDHEESQSSLENKLDKLGMEISMDGPSPYANTEKSCLPGLNKRLGSSSRLKFNFQPKKLDRLRISVIERGSSIIGGSQSSRRVNSPELANHGLSHHRPSLYSRLPVIERNMSESSRIKIMPFDIEASGYSSRSNNLQIKESSCRREDRNEIPKSKLYSSSQARVLPNKDRTYEFDKRIQRMKDELENMRKSCV